MILFVCTKIHKNHQTYHSYVISTPFRLIKELKSPFRVGNVTISHCLENINLVPLISANKLRSTYRIFYALDYVATLYYCSSAFHPPQPSDLLRLYLHLQLRWGSINLLLFYRSPRLLQLCHQSNPACVVWTSLRLIFVVGSNNFIL